MVMAKFFAKLYEHVYILIYRTIICYILNTVKYHESDGCIGMNAITTDQTNDILHIQSITYLSCTHAYAKADTIWENIW